MAVSRLRTALLALGLGLTAPYAAQAAMAVLDGTMVGKAIEQLKQMKDEYAAELAQLQTLKEQLSFLTDITKFVNETSEAIGALTHISLPIPRIDKFASQIKSDMRCLMPDGAGWGIKFEDMNLGSICDLASSYKSSLFVDAKQLNKMGFNEQAQARHVAESNRNAFFQDTVVRALAQSDVQMKQADELNKAADDLQSNLNNAATVQDRLHVQAQAQILQARAQASQSQTLAQLLKVTSAGQAAAGLSLDAVKEPSKTGEDGK
ncbi:MAG: hypothetical protein H7Z12_17660 [Rhodospirillaceae bacterium]|nr:hypothetical protein [Rhodospirillales bacterium]